LKRTLSLKREPLADLTVDDLANVLGGALAVPQTLDVNVCVTQISRVHTCIDCLTRAC
jgi:hypothetical protein